jgi:predicted RNase H-like HicB family nuclease
MWVKTVHGGASLLFETNQLTRHSIAMSTELIFEVVEAEEGGYCATALGHGITTQGDTLEELRTMVREAVACYFDDPASAPRLVRLHFARDEVLVP